MVWVGHTGQVRAAVCIKWAGPGLFREGEAGFGCVHYNQEGLVAGVIDEPTSGNAEAAPKDEQRSFSTMASYTTGLISKASA